MSVPSQGDGISSDCPQCLGQEVLGLKVFPRSTGSLPARASSAPPHLTGGDAEFRGAGGGSPAQARPGLQHADGAPEPDPLPQAVNKHGFSLL